MASGRAENDAAFDEVCEQRAEGLDERSVDGDVRFAGRDAHDLDERSLLAGNASHDARRHGIELQRVDFAGARGAVDQKRHRLRRDVAVLGIEHVHGTIEDYTAASLPPSMDVVAILWTLENCQDCRRMLDGAYQALKPGGVVVVATGSRILVPFKKPLHAYLGQNPADTHSFRFSANTLQGILAVSGFETTQINRYLDSDVLCVIARKTDRMTPLRWHGDPPMDVYTFFERWYVDTKMYYPDRA